MQLRGYACTLLGLAVLTGAMSLAPSVPGTAGFGMPTAQADEMPAGNASAGRKAFKAECRQCHSVRAGKYGTFGPNLHGVVGRTVGTGAEHNYSPALLAADHSWTPERLDAYIADPDTALPGNAMEFPGLADAQTRADIIAYLIAAGER